MIRSVCPQCGDEFDQVAGSGGRRREFCTTACRQAAYRQRRDRSGNEARSARSDAERETRQRARLAGRSVRPEGLPLWCVERQEAEQLARQRRKARALMEQALHAATGELEAAACRERAEALRVRYQLGSVSGGSART